MSIKVCPHINTGKIHHIHNIQISHNQFPISISAYMPRADATQNRFKFLFPLLRIHASATGRALLHNKKLIRNQLLMNKHAKDVENRTDTLPLSIYIYR